MSDLKKDYFNVFYPCDNVAGVIVWLNDPANRGMLNNSACLDAVVFCFNDYFITDFHSLLLLGIL